MMQDAVRQQGRPFALVVMLLATGLLSLVPTTAAANGDLALVEASSPLDHGYVNVLEASSFSVLVRNEDTQSSGPRDIGWEACPAGAPSGHAHCYSGSGTVPSMASGEEKEFSFNLWNPTGNQQGSSFGWTTGVVERNYSLTYSFDQGDFDASDDSLVLNITYTKAFANVDVPVQDPRSGLNGLGVGSVLNTNVTYPQSGDVWQAQASTWLCGSCGRSVEWGWRLYAVGGSVPVAESITLLDLSGKAWGGADSFTRSLPSFEHNVSGTFELEFGMMNASDDLVPSDNLKRVTIQLDDTSDLYLFGLAPTHNTEDPTAPWYYGEDALQASVENRGNTTLSGLSMRLTITDVFETTVIDVNDQYADYTCALPTLTPGMSHTCRFDLLIDLDDDPLTLTVSVPQILMVWPDVSPEDNVIQEENIQIIPGPVGASITQRTAAGVNTNGIYTTNDIITFTARTANTAAQPVNYSWYLNGLANIGYGQIIELDAGDLGIGVDYQVALIVRPAVGDGVSLFTSFDVLQYVPIDGGDAYYGGAVSAQPAVLEHEVQLPLLGAKYYIGNGKQPLMIHSFGIVDPVTGSDDVGLVDMRIQFNLSELLPSNIDPSTVELRLLDDINLPAWNFITPPNDLPIHNEDGTVDVVFRENVVILFVGVLPKPDVGIDEIELIRQPAGHLEVKWNASGDITNPYLAGWNIYRITAPSTASTYFPSPEVNTGLSFWEDYTETTYVHSVPLTTTSWYDPKPLAKGFCSSYLLAPADRSGASDLSRVAVSHAENGMPGLFCGDAEEPLLEVYNFRAEAWFNNDSACYQRAGDWNRCYELDLSWTWPDHEPEGPVSWDLYRLESDPSGVDLAVLTPLRSGMIGDPGNTSTYHTDGFGNDPVRPYRTYYYVLAPTDAVGNPNTLVAESSGNVVRVHINDEWWDYNQHLIPVPPPEPEPPLGSPWIGEFMDRMASDGLFQSALGVSLASLLVVLIMLPVVLNKGKRLKRIVRARARRQRSDDMANELDDFF